MTDRKLKALEIIDWYDGVVLALVELNWVGGEYLATLLAWDLDRRERVFALFPMRDGRAARIRACLASGDWSSVMSCVKSIAGEVTGEVLVVRVDEGSDSVVAEVAMDALDLQGDAIVDVEVAFSEERKRWFDITRP
jgi:hypothetical protein